MSFAIIAQIAGGAVVNVILMDPGSDFDATDGGRYSTVDVTALSPRPGPGWTYSGGVFIAPVPVATPDPNGFVTAIAGDPTLANQTRIAAVNSLAALEAAIASGHAAIITAVWQLMIGTYAISSADQAAVRTLAAQFTIPGIT